MATPAERMRAHRERTRRGLRRLTIDVSEDDLRTLPNGDTKGLQAWTPISGRKQSASSSTISFSNTRVGRLPTSAVFHGPIYFGFHRRFLEQEDCVGVNLPRGRPQGRP